MSTLRDAKCGDTVKVVKIHGEGQFDAGLWIWESQKMWNCILEKSHLLEIP